MTDKQDNPSERTASGDALKYDASPLPETSLKETVRDFIDRCRDREKRAELRKEFGSRGKTKLFHGTIYLALLALTVWVTVRTLDFSDDHRVKFYPPEEVVNYLTAEHETMEAVALKLMPSSGMKNDIPLESFDAKCVGIVKPLKIYGNEYGIFLMTSRDWYNGEHGIFIAKDGESMPPDLDWGLIEGRIYTYAIHD